MLTWCCNPYFLCLLLHCNDCFVNLIPLLCYVFGPDNSSVTGDWHLMLPDELVQNSARTRINAIGSTYSCSIYFACRIQTTEHSYINIYLLCFIFKILFYLSGDVMGPTLSGLESLLAMPTGCGEQNMLKFTPDIFIMQYLTMTNRLTEDVKAKAVTFMRTG